MQIYAVYFFSMSSLFLALIAGMNATSKNKIVTWEYLSGFGVVLFIYNWLEIISLSYTSSFFLILLKNIVFLTAFLLLLEFLRKNFVQMGKKIPLIFLYGIPAFVLALGLCFGLSVFYAFIRIFIAFGITFLITIQIYLNIKKNEQFRKKFLPLSIAVLLFGFTFVLVAPPEGKQNLFLLTSSRYLDLFFINIDYLRGVILFVVAAGAWNYLYYIRKKNYSDKDRKRKLIFGVLILASTMLVQVGGWLATKIYSDQALKNLKHENNAYMYFFNKVIRDEINLAESSLKGLSGSYWLHLALLSGTEEANQKATAVLDRYKESLKATSLFEMDSTGRVVVTSNRFMKNSYLGKNFSDLPYFHQSIQGETGQYLYLNKSTGQRMLTVSVPIYNQKENSLGVLVMERSLDYLLQNNIMEHGHICLVSPEGVIFLSDDSTLVNRIIYRTRIGEKERFQLINTYGKIKWEPVLPFLIFEDQFVDSGSDSHFVNSKIINKDGWRIVVLGDIFQIKLYRLFAIVLTMFITIILFVCTIIYFINQQLPRQMLQSEL